MPLSIDKTNTALLLLDFANDIVHPDGKFAGWGLPAVVTEAGAIPNTRRLLDVARPKGLTIIYVARHHRPGYPDMPLNTQLDQGVKATGALLEGTWGADICDELKPLPEDIIVIKRRVNAFHGTDLDVILRAKGIETLILTGVATSFVVEGTARTAADEGYNVMIAKNCVAGFTAEASAFTLENVLPLLATVTTSDEVMAAL